MDYCKRCSAPIRDNESQCAACGHPTGAPEIVHSQNSANYAAQGIYPQKTTQLVEQPKKKGMRPWFWIVIASVVVAGTVGIALILKPQKTYKTYTVVDEVEYIEEEEEAPSKEKTVSAETEEEHKPLGNSLEGTYTWTGSISTSDGSYPISLAITVNRHGSFEGKYWYHSTVNKYGTGPKNYMYVSGTVDSNNDFEMIVHKYKETSTCEEWSGTMTPDGIQAEGYSYSKGRSFSMSVD